MSGFVDLHCHCVPGIDDGVRSEEEAVALLRALHAIGFTEVVATPHMRPSLFDNDAGDIRTAFEALSRRVSKEEGLLPALSLSSEHYFDDIVFQRLLAGEGLPYPGGRAVLLEFYDMDFMPAVGHRLFDLRRRGVLPVIAHPERYRPLWRSHTRLAELVDAGAVALLDAGALVGKYGREPERCARRLLDDGLYHAACSDAHRPTDVDAVRDGMRVIRKGYGDDEVQALFATGPREILSGKVND